MQPTQKGSSLYIINMQKKRNSTKLVCVLINVVEKKVIFMHVAPKFKHLNYRTLHEYFSYGWTLGFLKLVWYCEVCNNYLIIKQAWRGSNFLKCNKVLSQPQPFMYSLI
jgi:hypothetical protein